MRHQNVFGTRLIVVSVLAVLVGCAAEGPIAPTSNGPVFPAPPDPSAPDRTVAGTVWVHGEGGVEPARGGDLWGWMEENGGGWAQGPIRIDADGRFQLSIPSRIARVRVFSEFKFQPCAVTVEPGDVTADVHVVVDPGKLGASLPASLQSLEPTLSGVVYEQTPEGRRPVPHALVSLDGLYGLGLSIAETITDADGRYVLCAVPHLPGLFLYASAAGFPLLEYGGDLIGRTTLDIEMRRVQR